MRKLISGKKVAFAECKFERAIAFKEIVSFLWLTNGIDQIGQVEKSTRFFFHFFPVTQTRLPKDKFDESIFKKHEIPFLHFYSSRQSTNHFVVRFKVEQPSKTKTKYFFAAQGNPWDTKTYRRVKYFKPIHSERGQW